MADTDYLILIQSPDATTILIDPVGPNSGRSSLGWRSIDLSPRFNEAGTGNFTAAADPALMAAVTTPEVRVMVIREPEGGSSVIEMAGPIENVRLEVAAERDGTDGPGIVRVQFADDLASLATRLVYPNPAQASTAQTVARYVVTTTNAEDAARALVNLNVGPGALTARKLPELVLGVDNGVGTSISTSFTRADVLTDALREVLRLGGNLGMRTVQVGATVEFQVYAPQNLTASVWFSRALGNIKELTFEWAAPIGTVAIVGDATAGTGRVVHERSNSAATSAGWRRKELFVDARSAANSTELDKDGDDALAENGPTARVSVTAIETPQQRYRSDFNIGDKVSVEVFDGFAVQEIVRGVDIAVTPERGEIVSPLIGTEGDSELDLALDEIQRLHRRIVQLEGAL